MLTTADGTKDGGKLAMTPGVRLRMAREGLNKTPQEVAQTLCLKLSVVESIEADSYELMPGSVFVRGYLRSYAKLLNIDPEEVIELFNRLGFVDKNSGGSSSFRLELDKTAMPTEGKVMRYVTYLVVLSLLILVFVWWNNQRNTSNPINDAAVTEQSMTAADPQPQSAQTNVATSPNATTGTVTQSTPATTPAEQVGAVAGATTPVDANAMGAQQNNAAIANQSPTPNVIVVTPPGPQGNAVTTIVPNSANPGANTITPANGAVPNASGDPASANPVMTPSPTTVIPSTDPTTAANTASSATATADAATNEENEPKPKHRKHHADVELAAPFE